MVMQRSTLACTCFSRQCRSLRPLNTHLSAPATRQQAQKQLRKQVTYAVASNQTSSAPSELSRPKPQQMLVCSAYLTWKKASIMCLLMLFCIQVYVPPHPLIKHWLAIARNKHSPTPIFRAAIAELGRLLIYELGRDWLPTMEGQIESPVALADAQYVDPSRPVKVPMTTYLPQHRDLCLCSGMVFQH